MSSTGYTPAWVKVIGALLLAGLGMGALALLHIIFMNSPDPADKAKLYLEAAKALLQFVGVLLLGALVTGVIKSFDKNRKADKALNEFRMDFLSRLRALDALVDDARFKLRSSGLTDEFGQVSPAFTPDRVDAYEKQIEALRGARGALDQLIQDIDTSRDAFSASVPLEMKLKDLKRMLDEVLEEFVKNRQQFPVQFSALPKLKAFTGASWGTSFGAWSAGHSNAVALVRKDLLPVTVSLKA